MKRYRFWIVGIVCALGIYTILSLITPTLYISEHGNDKNPGTKTQPLRTIQRGINRLSYGGTLHIAPGTYRETVDISNHAGIMLPISLLGDGEGVEIVGSEPSSYLDWQECTESTCPDIVSSIRAHVFIANTDWSESPTLITQTLKSKENHLLPLARSPDLTVTDQNKYHEHWWQTAVRQPSQKIIRDPVHVPTLKNISGARALIMDGQDRCGTFLYLRSVIKHTSYSESFAIDDPVGAVMYGHQEIGLNENSKYFIENSASLLDSPGEWYYDKAKHSIYLWPLEDNDPKHLSIEIGQRNVGIRINRSNVHIDGIRIKNINDSEYYSSFTGGIVIQPSRHIHTIRLSNLDFINTGDGISLETDGDGSVQGIYISSSKFKNIRKSAIKLIGNTNQPPSIDQVEIEHSGISNSGFLINESAINMARVKNIQIHNNTIHDVASTGIHVTGFEKNPYASDGIQIYDNIVARACQNGSGCAAIKVFGGNFSNSYIASNTVSDNLGWSFCQEKTQPVPGYAMGIFISNASGISVTDNISSRNSGPAFLGFTRQLPATRNTFSRNIAKHSLVGISLDGDEGDVDTDSQANSTRHNDSIISDNSFIQNDIAIRLDPAEPKRIYIHGNTYTKNSIALSYGNDSVATPSAIHSIFPFWER